MPILSIIIPTKNRIHYLKGCLDCIVTLNLDDVEVIIQDNSDNPNEVPDYLKEIDNKSIKYFYEAGKLSQTENSDLAMSHVTGDYVTYIGDDDTICESMIELARLMKKYGIDAACYGISSYNWPDLVESVQGLIPFQFYDAPVCIKELDAGAILDECMQGGMQTITSMPRIYHGIVSKAVMDKVYKEAGSFFPGPSPDMANATACALYVNKYIDISMPMIISGFGKSSAGGMGKRNLHKGTLKGNFQLRDDVELTWDKKIPKLWLQHTIWPNSASVALRTLQKSDYLKKMNYGIIYAETYLHDRGSLGAILQCKPTPKEVFVAVNHMFKRIKTRFAKSTTETNGQALCENRRIELTEAFVMQNLCNSKYSLQECFEEYYQQEENKL